MSKKLQELIEKSNNEYLNQIKDLKNANKKLKTIIINPYQSVIEEIVTNQRGYFSTGILNDKYQYIENDYIFSYSRKKELIKV